MNIHYLQYHAIKESSTSIFNQKFLDCFERKHQALSRQTGIVYWKERISRLHVENRRLARVGRADPTVGLAEYGKLTYANREVCEGEWKDGLKHGQGKATYANGDVYEGCVV
jgi:hypothetical protein